MKRTLLQRIGIAFKKAWDTPTLPDHILNFQNNLIIRVFRFLSGLSIISLLLINKIDIYTNIFGNGIFLSIFKYICLIFTLFYNIYLFYINYHRFIHIYKLIKKW